MNLRQAMTDPEAPRDGHEASPIRVTALDHVALCVPDPHTAAAFYRRVLGLIETGRDPVEGSVTLSIVPPDGSTVSHHDLILYPGDPAGLDHIALTVPDAVTLYASADLLRARGLAVEGPRDFESVHGPAIRVRDPEALTVELTVPMTRVSRPDSASPFDLIKLSHVNLKSPDPPSRARWWQQALDFRLSDRMGDVFFWLRCNRDHTTVAIVRSATPGLHHIGLEIASWQEVRTLADHFAANDVRIEFGPGRHGPGGSIFVYFLDPWKIRWEILCEIEQVPEDAKDRSAFWEGDTRRRVVNLWGPEPPDTFLSW